MNDWPAPAERLHATLPRRVLIAPACFKGTLSAQQVAAELQAFCQAHFPAGRVTYELCPIADGGDDTLSVLQAVDAGFEAHTVPVTGPLPAMIVQASYLHHSGQGLVVIEAAQAHGLKLLPPDRLLPLLATSYGVGELIRRVNERHRPARIIVTLGGSASTDGGVGALQALGLRVLDESGHPLAAPLGGGALNTVAQVLWPTVWPIRSELHIATDVINPLLGKQGAAAVFAPQKGATPAECAFLEANLQHLQRLMAAARGQQDVQQSGAGAAGGLAYGLQHLPGARLLSGSAWLAEKLDLARKVRQADLILTGEGRLDATSLQGKATGRLLALAADKPVLFFCGEAASGLSLSPAVRVYPLVQGDVSPQAAMAQPSEALRQALRRTWPDWPALGLT